MKPSENERLRTEAILAAAEQALFTTVPLAAALRSGSPGSLGDAHLGGKFNADGSFTSWFKAGDVVGINPVQPE